MRAIYPLTSLNSSRAIMLGLIDRSPVLVKTEVDNMTPAQARRIWDQIEKNFSYVASRSGNGRSSVKMQWLELLRKMTYIQMKAEAQT